MSHSTRSRRVLPRSLLLAVLAITTGWSMPSPAPIASPTSNQSAASIASAAAGVVAGAFKSSAWKPGADSRTSSAVLGLSTEGAGADTSRNPRRATSELPEPAPAKVVEAPKAKAKVKEPAKVEAPKAKASAPTYRGKNHFWIPSLGMSYNVRPYGCSQTFYPGNYIYRWGCAGRNNVYILGHAHSVMKPLHDLYVSGRLRKGMVAVYADAKGRVTKYKVTEWRVVAPTEVAWQIAAQPVPSMTLQTCVGKRSQYRLNVRLVAVK